MILNCKHATKKECNSCSLLNCDSYEQTLLEKMEKLKELFDEKIILPPVGCDYIVESRNKAKISVGGTVDLPILGATKSDGTIKEILECPLHLEEMNKILQYIKSRIKKYNLIPYSIKDKKGELKYLILYKSEQTGEIILRFVLRSKESLDRIRIFYEQDLKNVFPNIKIVSVNIQPIHQAIMEGNDEIILSESKMVKTDLGEKTLFLAPKSFFQVTSHVATKLYSKASEVINSYDSKNVLDLFCGVGAFAIFTSSKDRNVVGVELSKEAIECAKKSAESLEGNATFIAEDATTFIQNNTTHFDALITNPPRRGLNKEIIEKIKEIAPKVFIYSSCNPESLKRDYEDLKDTFELKEITPYDMFPLTNHMECLAVFELRD